MSRDAESELLGRCRRNDSTAWDELFSLHYDAACRFIFQLHHDFTREDAEEIAQEVFLSVIKNLDSFHGNSQFQTWLFRIATNKARDFAEKKRAAKRGGGQTPLPLYAQDLENGLSLDVPSDGAVIDNRFPSGAKRHCCEAKWPGPAASHRSSNAPSCCSTTTADADPS